MRTRQRYWVGIALFAVTISTGGVADAAHSWGPPYHWARTANPFTLKLIDSVSSIWDPYLVGASNDWSQSSVLTTTIVTGGSGSVKNCLPTSGRVRVCNAKYGFNGWLGIAQIWITGSEHITQGVVKLNDTYFNTATYNTPAWRRLVLCQEIGHPFGLDHQDTSFSNPNLGSCMDYTSDPDGPPSNEHPNTHDYDQLDTIYTHLDSSTTLNVLSPKDSKNGPVDRSDLGEPIRRDGRGRPSVYERHRNNGEKVVTFVFWAD